MESRLKIMAIALLLLGNNVCYGWLPWSKSAPVSGEDQVPSISIPWAFSDRNPNRYANLFKDMIANASASGVGQASTVLLPMQDILRDRGTAAQAAIQGVQYTKKSFFGQPVIGMRVFPEPQVGTTVSIIRSKIDNAGKALRAAYLSAKQTEGLTGFFQTMLRFSGGTFMDIITNINPNYNPANPNQPVDPEDTGYDNTVSLQNDSLAGPPALSPVVSSALPLAQVAPATYVARPSSQNQTLSVNVYLKQFAQKYQLVSYDSAFNGQIIKILSTGDIKKFEKAGAILKRYNDDAPGLKLSEKADKAIFISQVSPYVDAVDSVCAKRPEICTRQETEPFETVFMPRLLHVLKGPF